MKEMWDAIIKLYQDPLERKKKYHSQGEDKDHQAE